MTINLYLGNSDFSPIYRAPDDVILKVLSLLPDGLTLFVRLNKAWNNRIVKVISLSAKEEIDDSIKFLCQHDSSIASLFPKEIILKAESLPAISSWKIEKKLEFISILVKNVALPGLDFLRGIAEKTTLPLAADITVCAWAEKVVELYRNDSQVIIVMTELTKRDEGSIAQAVVFKIATVKADFRSKGITLFAQNGHYRSAEKLIDGGEKVYRPSAFREIAIQAAMRGDFEIAFTIIDKLEQEAKKSDSTYYKNGPLDFPIGVIPTVIRSEMQNYLFNKLLSLDVILLTAVNSGNIQMAENLLKKICISSPVEISDRDEFHNLEKCYDSAKRAIMVKVHNLAIQLGYLDIAEMNLAILGPWMVDRVRQRFKQEIDQARRKTNSLQL